jgi:hypothetical protein
VSITATAEIPKAAEGAAMIGLINDSLRFGGLVVLRKQGPITHRGVLVEKVSTTVRKRIRRGVWVPAFRRNDG